eukprot:115862-Pleurochrysis_carterae.AAC.1
MPKSLSWVEANKDTPSTGALLCKPMSSQPKRHHQAIDECVQSTHSFNTAARSKLPNSITALGTIAH